MDFRARPCVDLSHDRSQTSNHKSGLCSVCEKVDFVYLTSEACESCGTDNDGYHFHIGSLQHVARKTFCPGCRLILSAARTMNHNHDMFDKRTITITRRHLSAYSRDPDEGLPGHMNTSDAMYTPPMESFMEVGFDRSKDRIGPFDGPTIAGTIIRTREAETTNLTGAKSPILGLKNPTFRGRNVLPEVNIKLINQWMHSCNSQHDACHLPILKTSREQNIRLVDVQECRVISATLVENYVALSYVWGPATKPSLIQHTLSQCSSPGGLKDLIIPRTIKDAMQLVKFIGKRYLWVDSLCIVQDDDNDKKQQLTIMDSIYINAELVIVAAAGGDANAGLPGMASTPRRISQSIERIEGIEFMTAQASVQQVLNRSMWNSRGWTFQELMLSRRALVFTENQIYWGCQENTWREDISSESSVSGLRFNETNSLWPSLFRIGTMCRTSFYCRLASAFSRRHLKDERDVFWAFIGILRLQTSRFRKGFIWGLPYERLDATLLWSDTLGCSNIHSRRGSHSVFRESSLYDLQYPSWSWFSTNLPISFIDQCGDSVVSEVAWHEPLKFGDERSATYQKSISLKGVTDNHDGKLNASLLVGSTPESDIMDFGLLHFTAQTAVLTLRRAKKSSGNRNEKEGSRNRWIQSTVHSLDGKRIGRLTVPSLFFNKKSKRSGEIVLLSSNAKKETDERCKKVSEGHDCGTIEHVDRCRHIQSRNIMLIEYDGNIAYRQAIGVVKEKDWKEIETQVKTIVLG